MNFIVNLKGNMTKERDKEYRLIEPPCYVQLRNHHRWVDPGDFKYDVGDLPLECYVMLKRLEIKINRIGRIEKLLACLIGIKPSKRIGDFLIRL